jgi:hypothetical protein
METQREHAKDLLLAAAPVIVAASLHGPKNAVTETLATDLAFALQTSGYYEEDGLDLLEYASDELEQALADSPFFNQPTFAERLWDTVRAACRRIGHSLTSPATYAQGKAEIADYERRKGL